MAEVFDFQKNETVDLPDDEVTAAVASGAFGMRKGAEVPVIAADGSRGTIPAEEAQTAFSSGDFRMETDADRAEFAKQAEFESPTAQLRAGAEGVARGATFGLSDLVLSQLGDAEGVRERKERNPGAAITGELGSMVLNPLGGLGVGAKVAGKLGANADKIAKVVGKAPALVSKLGGAVEKGIGKVAGESLLARATAKAAATALEAEAFNIGHNMSEAALGDADITAERLLAHSGDAMKIGAGLGFATPLAGKVLAATASKAKGALDDTIGLLRDKVLPKVGEAAAEPVAAASAGLSGAAKQDVKEMLAGAFTAEGAAMRKQLLEGVTPEARDKIAREFMTSVKNSFDETAKAVKQSFKAARPQEIETLLKGVPIQGAATKAEQLLANAKQTIAEMRAQPDVFTQRGLIAKLEQTVAGFEDKLVNGGVSNTAELFQLGNGFKQTIDKQVAKWGRNISPEAIDTVEKVRAVRDLAKGFLEDGEAFGEAAARQQAFNSAFTSQKAAQDEMLRLFGDRVVVNGKPTRQLSSTKIDTYLRQVGSGRGDARETALQNWLKSSKSLVEEMEKSHINAGQAADFDKAGLQSLIEKSLGARQVAEKQLGDLNRLRALDPLAAGATALSGAQLMGVPGVAAAMMKTIGSPSALVKTLSTAEGLVLNASKRLNNAADAFVSASKKIATKLPPARDVIAPLSVRNLGEHVPATARGKEKDKKPPDKAESFKLHFGQIAKLVANPANSSTDLDAGYQQLGDHAPVLRSALVSTQLRAAQFLYNKAPKNPAADVSINPLIDDWKPSDTEIAKWDRYRAAVNDPLGVVEDMKHGMLSREGVEALRAVYPNLYNDVVGAFTERIGELQTKLPYAQRLNLSILLGVPADRSTTPQFVAAMQQAHGQAIQEEQNQAPKMNAGANVDLSSDSMTTSQRIAAR